MPNDRKKLIDKARQNRKEYRSRQANTGATGALVGTSRTGYKNDGRWEERSVSVGNLTRTDYSQVKRTPKPKPEPKMHRIEARINKNKNTLYNALRNDQLDKMQKRNGR